MKKINILYVIVVFSLTFLLASCGKEKIGDDGFVDPEDNEPVSVTLGGEISHDVYTAEQEGSCEVNRIPKSFAKFKEMYAQAAIEPQGAVTMFVVAIEMYRQNPEVGERCMAYSVWRRDASDPNKMPAVEMSKVKQKLLGTDGYAQPYIPMAYFEGATPANKYKPTKYKCNVFVPSGDAYSPLSSAKAMVIPLNVKSYGEDWNHNPNRAHNITVVKPNESIKGYPKNCYVVNAWNDLFMGILVP